MHYANPDRVCLNCRHWQVSLQIGGSKDGEICRLGKGHTAPTDTCSQFMAKSTFDSLQDPSRYHRPDIYW